MGLFVLLLIQSERLLFPKTDQKTMWFCCLFVSSSELWVVFIEATLIHSAKCPSQVACVLFETWLNLSLFLFYKDFTASPILCPLKHSFVFISPSLLISELTSAEQMLLLFCIIVMTIHSVCFPLPIRSWVKNLIFSSFSLLKQKQEHKCKHSKPSKL